MKKSRQYISMDFGIPHRQSYVAILMIIWKTYKIVFKTIWPILVLYLLRGSTAKMSGFIWFLIVFSLIAMIFSIVSFFRFYFFIKNDELIIHKGVFIQKKIHIPFEKVQTINFDQNILQKVFNVVRLKIDTAGSSKEEFDFHAIEIEKAEQLRDLILSKKAKSKKLSLVAETKTTEGVASPAYRTILHLTVPQLIKAGLVENHIRSLWIIIAFLFWIWDNLREVNLQSEVEKTLEAQWSNDVIMAAILMGILTGLSLIISMVNMVLKYYDLRFMRSEKGFKVVAGFFTKRDASAMDYKIQMISWHDNILQKIIGIKYLILKQASSNVVSRKKSIKIPGCTNDHIDEVKFSLYGRDAFDEMTFYKSDRKYLYRYAVIYILVFASLTGGLLYIGMIQVAMAAVLAGLFFLLKLYLKYRKMRHGFNHEMLIIRGGVFADKEVIMPLYKIQNMAIKRTPYQRRNGLANLTIFTASGAVTILYVPYDWAIKMMDYFLYKVESDRRKWM